MAGKKKIIDPEIVSEVVKPLVIALASWATHEIVSYVSRKKAEREKNKTENADEAVRPTKKTG